MKHSRLWTGLSAVGSFLLVFSVLGYQSMTHYSSTVNQLLGISTSIVENPENTDQESLIYYESEFGELNAENLQKVIEETYEESVQEEAEGAVLLKNDNNTLPLSDEERSVTLFGHATAQPLYRSSAAGSKGYTSEYGIDLYEALQEKGFEINDALYEAYVSSSAERKAGGVDMATGKTIEPSFGEVDAAFYTEELQASWQDQYNDVAIVMLAREGGEGSEIQMNALTLQQDEKDLLQMINDSGKFEKVILLLNSGNPMELEWLDEYGIDACLWIGEPGQRGFEAVAGILTGEVSPSGHLTDTYARNIMSSPATVNGSWNYQNWTNLEEVLNATEESDSGFSWYTVQAEGIYVGYKYYETRYEDIVLGQGNADSSAGSSDGGAWNYADEVRYPFGYGLSYTEFEQTLDSVEVGNDEIEVKVTVTNTGDRAGKSVVQLYAQTPYGEYEKENLVEKSSIQLLDFAKTGIIEPGESETVTIDADKYLLASYDYVNAQGYILSEGDYYLSIGDDAHDALNNVLAAKGATNLTTPDGQRTEGTAQNTYHWTENFDAEKYYNSRATGEEVTNQFADCDLNSWIDGGVTYLSRNDWEATYPVAPVTITATEEMIRELTGNYYEKADDAVSASTITQGEKQDIPLAALRGLDYDDPLWEEYLDQFTIEELGICISDTTGTAEISEVGKPAITIGDGPDGVNLMFDGEKYGDGREACCYPAQIVLASTFNKELMENRGSLMAEEAMYLGIPMIWMPGANLHRTPFGGRNFEYYSEDANMTYLCTIPSVKAMEEKGVHAGPKHLTANDQENGRMGISTFFNEQAFREGGLRGFEGAVVEGQCKAIMHGYNRIGMTWCSYSEALCSQVLEKEWGFVGEQETDATAGQTTEYFSHYTKSIMTGTDSLCLDFGGVGAGIITQSITDNDDGDLLNGLRKSAHDYLYIMANSILMNGFSEEAEVISVTPWWVTAMYSLIAAFALLDAVCVFMMFRKNSGMLSRRKES